MRSLSRNNALDTFEIPPFWITIENVLAASTQSQVKRPSTKQLQTVETKEIKAAI